MRKKRDNSRYCQLFSDFEVKRVLANVTVIDSLPGGFGQDSVPLAEPIISESFSMQKVLSHQVEEFHESMVPEKKRLCKRCNKGLAPTRYFECKKCVPKLPDDINEHYIGSAE